MHAVQTETRNRQQRGITLIELIVSVAIMASLGGLVTSISFAMFSANENTNSKAQVSIDVTRSTRWLSRDVHRAASSDLIDAAAAVPTAEFTWTDAGALVNCVYSLNGTDFQRNCGGVVTGIARGVSALSFTRSGDLITVAYTVTSTLNANNFEAVQLTLLLGGG